MLQVRKDGIKPEKNSQGGSGRKDSKGSVIQLSSHRARDGLGLGGHGLLAGGTVQVGRGRNVKRTDNRWTPIRQLTNTSDPEKKDD